MRYIHIMRIAIALVVCMLARTAIGDECLKDAHAADEQAAKANAANDKRYAEALAKQKLAPLQLALHKANPAEQLPDPRKADTTAAAGALRLVVETSIADCVPFAPPFARRGDKIYRVQRAPQVRSTKLFTVCGCRGGTHCGGQPKPTYALGYFELPAGTDFAGVLDIAYDADDVEVRGQSPCPPPP
jgi:hypothetical protein